MPRPTKSSSLSDIAADLNKTIYSHPYKNTDLSAIPVKRTWHGMDHVSRASIFGSIAFNLMILCNSHEMATLSAAQQRAERRLVQLALLLHDSAREGEGEDLWDLESGIQLYHYLIKPLGYEPTVAKRVAEAMINKDWAPSTDEGKYIEIYPPTDGSGSITASFTRKLSLPLETERLRLAIQFGDCVDIFRLPKKIFDWRYLELYQKTQDPEMRKIIERILPECFKLIQNFLINKKRKIDAFVIGHLIFDGLIDDLENYPLLQNLYEYESDQEDELKASQLLSSGDPITDSYIEMNLLFRGVTAGSSPFIRSKERTPKEYPKYYSGASQEVRKTLRRPDIPTSARTESKRLEKEGNPSRSMSLIGQGGQVYTGVGAGIILKKQHLISAHLNNIASGFGAKSHLSFAPRGSASLDEELAAIRQSLRSGEGAKKHNEILGDISEWDCILYSADDIDKDKRTSDLRFLEAVFLANAYAEQHPKKPVLPIYEFSNKLGTCIPIEVTNELLLIKYNSLLIQYIKPRLEDSDTLSSYEDIVKLLETQSIITQISPSQEIPLNHHYDQSLSHEIEQFLSQQLKTQHTSCCKSYCRDFIQKYTFENIPLNDLNRNLILLNKQIALGVNATPSAVEFFTRVVKLTVEFIGSALVSLRLDLMIIIAQKQPFTKIMNDAITYFLNQNSVIPLKATDDYLKIAYLIFPESTARNKLFSMIVKNVENFIDFALLRAKPSFLELENYTFPDILELSGPVKFGNHYTPEIHQEFISQLNSNREKLLSLPLKNHIDSYLFTNDPKDLHKGIDIFHAMLHKNIFTSSASNLFEAYFRSLLNNTIQILMTTHPLPPQYSGLISIYIAQFISKVNLNRSFIPTQPLSHANTFIGMISHHTQGLTEEKILELLFNLMKRSIPLRVAQLLQHDEPMIKKICEMSLNQFIANEMGGVELGEFYTAQLHDTLLNKLECIRSSLILEPICTHLDSYYFDNDKSSLKKQLEILAFLIDEDLPLRKIHDLISTAITEIIFSGKTNHAIDSNTDLLQQVNTLIHLAEKKPEYKSQICADMSRWLNQENFSITLNQLHLCNIESFIRFFEHFVPTEKQTFIMETVVESLVDAPEILAFYKKYSPRQPELLPLLLDQVLARASTSPYTPKLFFTNHRYLLRPLFEALEPPSTGSPSNQLRAYHKKTFTIDQMINDIISAPSKDISMQHFRQLRDHLTKLYGKFPGTPTSKPSNHL